MSITLDLGSMAGSQSANAPPIRTDPDPSRDFPFSKLLPELQIKVFEHSLNEAKSISKNEKPTKPDVLCLSKPIFQKLGPRYYQTKVFAFKTIRDFINDYLRNATGVCLSNTTSLCAWFVWSPGGTDADDDEDIASLEMFVNMIDMISKLPMLWKIEMHVYLRSRMEVSIVPDQLWIPGGLDCDSEDAKQRWYKFNSREWSLGAPAKCEENLQEKFLHYKVESFVVLTFGWGDVQEVVEVRRNGKVPSAPWYIQYERTVVSLTKR